MRPWSPIPIKECGECLQPLPGELLRMEPHPYMALGAPYGPSGQPFQLRQGVVRRRLMFRGYTPFHINNNVALFGTSFSIRAGTGS